jgi:pyruvate dehydrogenase E1 component
VPKTSYLEKVLHNEEGVFIAVSDYMKMVPDQIAPWVPGGLMTLGTDGFGRSDTRAHLRRFFEVDAELTTLAALYALHQKEAFAAKVVEEAIRKLGIDPEKPFPFYL